MKKLITAFIFACLLPLIAEAGQSLDQIVAVVEDDVILRSELDRALRTNRRKAGESKAAHEERVLEILMTEKAHKIASTNAGIKVTDAEVDEAVGSIAARNRISVAKMAEILNAQGVGYSNFRENIRKQLAQRKFHQSQLASQVQVTDSEIDSYLSLHGGGKVKNVTQYRTRHILLRPGERLSNKEARTRLEEYRKRIAAGESFTDLARANSDDTASAVKGGDLGWVSPGQATPQFERVMRSQPKNTVSRPFQSEFGWHILEVVETRKHQMADEAQREAARTKIQQRKIEESLDLLTRRLREQAYTENRLNQFD